MILLRSSTNKCAENSVVQVMHQTVREFFNPNGPAAQSAFRMNSKDAHIRIFITCIRYIMLCVTNTSSIYQQRGSNSWKPEDFNACAHYLSRRPFLNYALEYIERHLQEYGQVARDSELVSQLCEKLNRTPAAAYLLGNWIPQDWGQEIATLQELSYGEHFRAELLHTATHMKYSQVVEALLIAGAQVEVNLNGKTPLMVAAAGGDLATARVLLDRGALIGAKDANDKMALHLAAGNGHNLVASMLIDRGADKEAKDKNGQTALHLAAANEHVLVASLLIDRGADKEAEDTVEQTALHLAAANGHDSIIKLLVHRGSIKEAKDVFGWEVLHMAAWNGHEATIQMLVQSLHVNKEGRDRYGWTALHVAAMNGCNATSQWLVEQLGLDKEARDNVGWTALHFAAALGLADTAYLLIRILRVDRGARNNRGEAAIDLAREW